MDPRNVSRRPALPTPLALLAACLVAMASATALPASDDPLTERLVLPDGGEQAGRLVGDPTSGFRFRPDDGGPLIPLAEGVGIVARPAPPDPIAGLAPFRLRLGMDQVISGRLIAIDADKVQFLPNGAAEPIEVARAGLVALDRRPGEVEVFHDGFETLDEARWGLQVGDPTISGANRLVGSRSLRIQAGGSAVTHRLAEPIASGRLDLAFFDPGGEAPGHTAFIDLTFAGPEAVRLPVRVVIGWEEATLAVESPGGPRLPVQRLQRREGWHRLSVSFGGEDLALSVDGDELAHGDPPPGPLVEIRLATSARGGGPAPEGLALFVDDLSLSRKVEPVGSAESEPLLDEIRMASGDQIFGRLESAGADRFRVEVDVRTAELDWAEVVGVRFHRRSTPSAPIEGQLVRVEWRASSSDDPRESDRIEGTLIAASLEAIELDVPHIGRMAVPRAALRSLTSLGSVRRILLDPFPRHLGDRFDPAYTPPQPEPEPCEVSFELTEPPGGPSLLRLDVIGVIGETGNPGYSDQVARGEYRTTVLLNDEPLGDLNPLISTPNETPERVGLPIPAGRLRTGINRIRFVQGGTADDPSRRDNLGVLGLAIETPIQPPQGVEGP